MNEKILLDFQSDLQNHPVYNQLTNLTNLKIFMSHHVFAVWDFMSLIKRLQKEITCVETPWRPSRFPKEIVRMINEIVLGEESDEDGLGGYLDHFSLYLKAMEELSISTKPIRTLINTLDLNIIPNSIRPFVNFNLNMSQHGALPNVAAVFFYGREDIIPRMFKNIVAIIDENKIKAPSLTYYLKRHIELDGDHHSIMAKKCLDILCENNPTKISEAISSGIAALQLRKELWNSVLREINLNLKREVTHSQF